MVAPGLTHWILTIYLQQHLSAHAVAEERTLSKIEPGEHKVQALILIRHK